MDHSRPVFALSSFFPSPLYTIKIVDFSGIQTRIIGVDGEHADHLTTTMYLQISSFLTDFHWLVSVPPKRPIVLNDKGVRLDSTIGPFNEGESVRITCMSDKEGESRRPESPAYGLSRPLFIICASFWWFSFFIMCMSDKEGEQVDIPIKGSPNFRLLAFLGLFLKIWDFPGHYFLDFRPFYITLQFQIEKSVDYSNLGLHDGSR